MAKGSSAPRIWATARRESSDRNAKVRPVKGPCPGRCLGGLVEAQEHRKKGGTHFQAGDREESYERSGEATRRLVIPLGLWLYESSQRGNVHHTMAENSYHVYFPSGETRGPLSLREVKDQALEGKIPRDAQVKGDDGTFTVFEMVTKALGRPTGTESPVDPEKLALLASTYASTPRAKKRRSSADG
jgi:hypothetical protein